MRRFRTALGAAVAVATLAACKIEQTPQQFFDQRRPVAVERQAAAEEVRNRILALGQGLYRGSRFEVLSALNPTAEVYVVSPSEDLVLDGEAEVLAALERIAASPVAVRFHDVHVEASPTGAVAWFRARVEAPGRGPNGTTLRVTGVYLRLEGEWRLAQAHVSAPTEANLEAPSPAAAAAREGGG